MSNCVKHFCSSSNKTVFFQRTTNILIVDNATWHRRKDTHWYRWQPKYLPPDFPDLNPIERIWLTIKARQSALVQQRCLQK